jgi:RNA 2',3'-cyclic 3'-phosphodiesterase
VTTRLFVALWPNDAARASLDDAIAEARQAVPDLRWQSPERWHVTLAFLGATDPGKAAARIETLMQRDAPNAPICPEPIRLAASGAFGPVVWVGVEHGPWLTDLATDLQQSLRVADRRFRAHVTVARARGAGAHIQARAAVPTLTSYLGPCWSPGSVTLVDSRTGPQPEYTVLQSWTLQGYREFP